MIRRYWLVSLLEEVLYQGESEGSQHPKQSCAALRLQNLLNRAWRENPTAPQGERANASRVAVRTQLSFDPDTASGKRARHLPSDAFAYRADLPNSRRETRGRARGGR